MGRMAWSSAGIVKAKDRDINKDIGSDINTEKGQENQYEKGRKL
jgi:hypothetical protein